ncbi:hypothetical protein BOO30_10715 [Vibrio navarrensis]|nr:hypothetical protein [Vibrio navarrensis]MBE4596871.1 hypothetical protein [Vibrio navarrensis]
MANSVCSFAPHGYPQRKKWEEGQGRAEEKGLGRAGAEEMVLGSGPLVLGKEKASKAGNEFSRS